jgi:hypothetical protein
MLLRERLTSDRQLVLASTVAGTGVALTRLEGVLLRLLTEIPESQWRAWVGEFAARQPFRLKVGDVAVEGDARVDRLLEQIEPFRAKRLPRLVELGLVVSEGIAQ